MTSTRITRMLTPLCCGAALVLGAGVSTATADRPARSCAPAHGYARGAGVLTVDGTAFRIRSAGASRQIARAFRDCGYNARAAARASM